MEDYHQKYCLRNLLIGAGLHDIAQKIRPLTAEQALEDYENLKSERPGTNLTGRIGNRAVDFFFFEKRLDTGSKKKDQESFPEFLKRHGWNDAPSYKRLYKMNRDNGNNSEQAAYSVFSLYWGAINSFKPLIARMVYEKAKPTTVLDFSAGWGGRALAAMSMDINYIGFDTNTDLKKPYADMIKMFPHKSDVKIHFQDSSKVDYSKYNYDMVFTSPPYFQKERPTEAYKNMPHYKDRADFNERFLFPVVRNTYNNLKSGGTYALNVPMDMYDDLLPVLGKAHSKVLLPKIKRGGSGEGTYKEYIYFWKKGAEKLKGGSRERVKQVATWILENHPFVGDGVNPNVEQLVAASIMARNARDEDDLYNMLEGTYQNNSYEWYMNLLHHAGYVNHILSVEAERGAEIVFPDDGGGGGGGGGGDPGGGGGGVVLAGAGRRRRPV